MLCNVMDNALRQFFSRLGKQIGKTPGKKMRTKSDASFTSNQQATFLLFFSLLHCWPCVAFGSIFLRPLCS